MRKWKIVLLPVTSLAMTIGSCLTNSTFMSNQLQVDSAKIDICSEDIFNAQTGEIEYTQATSLFSAPTKTDILTFLASIITNHTYDNVINDLIVPSIAPNDKTVTITVNPNSQLYTGQVIVNWTFATKSHIVDCITIAEDPIYSRNGKGYSWIFDERTENLSDTYVFKTFCEEYTNFPSISINQLNYSISWNDTKKYSGVMNITTSPNAIDYYPNESIAVHVFNGLVKVSPTIPVTGWNEIGTNHLKYESKELNIKGVKYVASSKSVFDETMTCIRAFNGTAVNSNDAWQARTNPVTVGDWLQIDLGTEAKIYEYSLSNRISDNVNDLPRAWTILGSNTDIETEWNELDKMSSYSWNEYNKTESFSISPPSEYYRYYRFRADQKGYRPKDGGEYIAVEQWELFGIWKT